MNRYQLLLFVILVRSAAFATGGLQNPQIVVCVYKEAGVSDAILEKAEEQTARLFRRSLLPLVLQTCSNHPSRTQGRGAISEAVFYIHVVPKAASLSDDAFGVAFLGSDGTGRYADVFFDSVRRLQADQKTASTAEILGYVMAHEIGHLLLGFHAHSSTGIMEARWSGPELQSIAMGRLAFTPEQCRRLLRRAELMKHEHEVAASKAADFAR
jgi:hypothetical protein